MMEGFIARSHSAHFVSLDRANQPGAGGGHGHRTHGHYTTLLPSQATLSNRRPKFPQKSMKRLILVDVVHSM